MLLLPYEKVHLSASLNSQQLVERLRDAVDSSKPGWSWKWPNGFCRNSSKPFEGTLDGSSFKISRIINYHSSFLPVIIGKIGESTVDITLRPSILVIIFMVVWLVVVWAGFFYALCHHWIEMETAGGMYLLGILLFLIPFKIEAKVAKRKLKELLEAA